MMEDLWTIFCGESECSYGGGKQCSSAFMLITHPSSCINNVLVTAFDVLLLLMFLFNFIRKPSPAMLQTPSRFQGLLPSQIFSAIFNGGLGVVYFSYGIWILQDNLRNVHTILPLHQWLVLLFQGFTWFLLALTISLRGKQLPKAFLRLWSVFACSFAGILCVFSLLAAIVVKQASVRIVLDILSLPGAILLLLCTYKVYKFKEIGDAISSPTLYTPLNGQANGSGESETDLDSNVTPFADAGFISKMFFWWLSPLVRKGGEKTLEEEDIPRLREVDRAETCYTLFMEKLNKRKQSNLSTPPSILWTIVSCHWKEILISGFFASLKVITMSAGPLLLNAFIQVAEGKEVFKYEGYVLAMSLFIAKCLESLSQRQWYFRSRIIGIKVRSLLSAAIYKKQLRLSNAAKMMHSAGNIMNYVTVDAYRVGELPYWFHQTWTTSFQLCIALVILFHAVGLATFAALVVIILTVLCNTPLAKLQNKFQTKLMVAQDQRLKACSEALVNMKVLKLYAWETHFKDVIERFRSEEYTWLSAVQMRKAYNILLFWTSPVLVSAATFGACYFLGIPLNASNVFTFVATLRLVQDPVRTIPDVIGVVIQAKVSLERIVKFLEAPELQNENIRQKGKVEELRVSISMKSADLSWEENPTKLTLRNINLVVKPGEKVAVCGEVGSGKSTLLAAILGEVPFVGGTIQVYGKIAYVSQMAWIQTGTIQGNILFGSPMEKQRYQEVLEKCSLLKDLEMLPFGDLTEIGERGVNLSGGQKQRLQLARALYQDADIYLLDDPFSAVDAHTATSLFNEYVMGALSEKAVILVTHQVDFLPAFDSVLLMSDGEILHGAPYHQLLASNRKFQELVNAHKDTAGSEPLAEVTSPQRVEITSGEVKKMYTEKQFKASTTDQLIKQEEREIGDTSFKPYIQYLMQNKGFLYFTIAGLCHIIFVAGQISQNAWMAANVQNPHVSELLLITVYLVIGFGSTFILVFRSLAAVALCIQTSKSIFSQLLNSLFRAPMSFYDSTPLGRILSRVSSDLSIVDLDVPFSLIFTFGSTANTCASLGVLAFVTWQVLFVYVPVIYLTLRLQKYYFSSAKELMRINGTTKSFVANHLAESIAGAMTIRAFEDEERFFATNLNVIDRNASPFFHNFSANEWLIQRLELLSATVLSSSALAMVLLPPGTFGSGFVGMALSYGLSLNMSLIFSIQNQCTLANYIISVERLNQYMHIPSEASEVIEENQPPPSWPAVGKVEICDLEIRYRPDTPLVLSGISCTFEGGHKIGIVGRTGSGKTTLISALFRLVEPADGKIIIDNIDISMIGLHDLRSRIGIIPQDPTLFNGTIRYNLDPLSQYTDEEIWEVLGKCQLQDAVKEKEKGLDGSVVEDGSNWSMGQRQLFCLGRALLRRSRILVLDEATASIDNATDAILQKTIRTEFADCTVITVAHRIPTVMDCTKVLAMSDGKVVEYDEPTTLMNREGSLFGQLVREYWSHFHSANQH
ncbi:ABC transporter C family member 10-like [Macadamia integrifolia]|uniref:ABC transporter C family member 10-like n=1 Tax=Macadamia integrifolia TaxID=60698 RepID=UPI001C4EFB6D|nr:ABC transporter C family member 10-like [Macadamia integrifolia]